MYEFVSMSVCASVCVPGQAVACALHVFVHPLQDRVEEAQRMFRRIGAPEPDSHRHWGHLQYKYLEAYLDFFSPGGPRAAAAIAASFSSYPVPKWRARFGEVAAQLEEAVAARAPSVEEEKGDGEAPPKRARRLDRLAATEPALSIHVEAKRITLTYANVKRASLRFYPMDIELLFSSK